MTLTKSLIISGSLFAIGVIIQSAMKQPATSWETMTGTDYLYLTFYLLGLTFTPLYPAIAKLIGVIKNKIKK